jgi:osmotically-inducible protein OsmY
MNKEQFENQWPQIRAALREKWNHLTDEDIRQINGRYDQLITKLQQRYGYTREIAEEELRNWVFERARTYGHERTYVPGREEDAWRARRSDSATGLKWALAAGLPLLLLAGYLAHQGARTYEDTFTGRQIPQTIVAESPTDRDISQNIRQGLYQNGVATADLENIRIEIVNGVVTIRGIVPSTQMRNSIQQIVENTPGVRRVNNQLEVR